MGDAVSVSHRDSVGGGGVVAAFSPGLQKSRRFSGGGGGVVAEFFLGLPKADAIHAIKWGGDSTTNVPIMCPFTLLRYPKGGGRPLNRPLRCTSYFRRPEARTNI